MISQSRDPALRRTRRLGLMGTRTEDVDHLLAVAHMLWCRGVDVIVAFDGSRAFPAKNNVERLDAVDAELAGRGQMLYLIGAGEEIVSDLREGHRDGQDQGLRLLRPTIAAIAGGVRARLHGGAHLQVTRDERASARDSGSREASGGAVTPREQVALTEPFADVLLGQQQVSLADITSAVSGSETERSPAAERFLDEMLRVRPTKYIGTHHGPTIDDVMRFARGDNRLQAHVVLLGTKARSSSFAVLDAHTLDLRYFRPDDTLVTELVGHERGRWKVTTQSSRYEFDLDRGTVARHPGTGAAITINDLQRPLREIVTCQVGESGRWTMRPDGGPLESVDYYWSVSTPIVTIERLPDDRV